SCSAAEAQALRHLRRMTMAKHIVCLEALTDFDEVCTRSRRFACACYAGFRIADDRLTVCDQASFDERHERNQDRSRIAAGIGDEFGAAQFFPRKFAQAVNGLRQKIGPRVLKAIKL